MRQERKRTIGGLCLLFMVNILLISLFQTAAQGATYRQGSTGAPVRAIQSKLERWGYYDGAVDGIYGSGTAAAVRRFQQKNGLTADGVVGPATLRAMGLPEKGEDMAAESAEVELLARVISAEARGEPYSGQVAVGAVILNRVAHPAFPGTIAGVVYQPGAFACSGRWTVRRTGLRVVCPGGPGRHQRRGPQRRGHLLLQSGHCHQRLDLEPPPHQGHRPPPLLRLSLRRLE